MLSNKTSKLTDKNVLLIGGSAGIGFAVAQGALQEGARITISSSSKERVAKAVEQLQTDFPEHASNVRSYTADLSTKENIEGNVEKILQYASQDSTIDHIVFTAGNVPPMRPLTEASLDDIEPFLLVRVYGALAVGKHASKYMTPGKASSITLTSSSQAQKPLGWIQPLVSNTVEGLMRGLAVTLRSIRVNVVAPGFILTDLIKALPQELVEKAKARSLTNDHGYPDDTAEAYLYFMKDTFVTGTVLDTNGGIFLM
jgi:NAD(P)-dependent dehydrogenase (short-subunit alcohol dehydrogenase family)